MSIPKSSIRGSVQPANNMRSVIGGILRCMVDRTFPWGLLAMSTRPSRAHEVAHDREDHGARAVEPAAPDGVPASRVGCGSIRCAGADHGGSRTDVAAATITPIMQASTTVATTVDRRTPGDRKGTR